MAKKKSPALSQPNPLQASLQLTATAEFISAAAEDGQLTLPRFRMLAYTGSPMRIAGWRYPVVVDLAGMAIPSQARPIRFSHDPSAGVGHTDSIRVETGQLVATGIISRDTSAAHDEIFVERLNFPEEGLGVLAQEVFVEAFFAVLINDADVKGLCMQIDSGVE